MEEVETYQDHNLTDLVVGVDDSNKLDIDVSVRESGRIIVFHSHPFKSDLALFEFNLTTNMLNFILEDGEARDTGLPLTEGVAKHMQNAHQILTILLDPKSGESEAGRYIPLILHQ